MGRLRPRRRSLGWWVGRRRWGSVAWKATVAAVVVLSALVPFWNWLRPPTPVPTPQPAPPPRTEPKVFLIMGIDRHAPDDPGRCDTVMMVTMDSGGQPVGFLSVRRDSLAKIPGHGWDKINHSYAFGGPRLAQETVSWLIDRPVDHYLAANFEGFRRLVDAVGGVEVDIPERLYHYDPEWQLLIDLGPGRLVLNGTQALNYCRFRSDAEGDFGRTRRQQAVLRELGRKLLQPGMVVRLPELVRIGLESLETDLTMTQALSLGVRVRRALESQDVEMFAMQGQNARLGPEGEWYVINDLAELRTRLHRMLTGQEPPPALLEKAQADQAELKAGADAMGWYRLIGLQGAAPP